MMIKAFVDGIHFFAKVLRKKVLDTREVHEQFGLTKSTGKKQKANTRVTTVTLLTFDNTHVFEGF